MNKLIERFLPLIISNKRIISWLIAAALAAVAAINLELVVLLRDAAQAAIDGALPRP